MKKIFDKMKIFFILSKIYLVGDVVPDIPPCEIPQEFPRNVQIAVRRGRRPICTNLIFSIVIASEAKQSSALTKLVILDCFVASLPRNDRLSCLS